MFETIDYGVEGAVAVIRLNRPSRHNAINGVMSRELPLVWEHFKNDDSAIVAILTGCGDRAFCSGADLSDLPVLGQEGGALRHQLRWTPRQNQVWKPVICAVNGMTVGGGLHFVADSDIVIASNESTFFDSHVRIGLVGECVPREQLMGRAMETAGMIARNSPSAMAGTKQAIWQSLELSLDAALANASRIIEQNNAGPDFHEGRRALLEHRPPRWAAYSQRRCE